MPILVLFLAGLFGGISGSFLEFRFGSEINMDLGHFELPSRILAIFSTVFVVLFVLILLYGIFVGNVLTVGARGWFLRYGRGEYPNIGDMFAGVPDLPPGGENHDPAGTDGFPVGAHHLRDHGDRQELRLQYDGIHTLRNPNLPPSRAMKMSEILTDGAQGGAVCVRPEFHWLGAAVVDHLRDFGDPVRQSLHLDGACRYLRHPQGRRHPQRQTDVGGFRPAAPASAGFPGPCFPELRLLTGGKRDGR